MLLYLEMMTKRLLSFLTYKFHLKCFKVYEEPLAIGRLKSASRFLTICFKMKEMIFQFGLGSLFFSSVSIFE